MSSQPPCTRRNYFSAYKICVLHHMHMLYYFSFLCMDFMGSTIVCSIFHADSQGLPTLQDKQAQERFRSPPTLLTRLRTVFTVHKPHTLTEQDTYFNLSFKREDGSDFHKREENTKQQTIFKTFLSCFSYLGKTTAPPASIKI